MKLLVISMAGNGDTLFATPLIHELRANYPAAQIDALVRWRGARELLEGNPYLNAVHERDLLAGGRLGSLEFLLNLRRQGYDVSFNTHPQSRILYRIVARFIGARVRVSHHYDGASFCDRWLINHSIAENYSQHAIDNNLDLLRLMGAKAVLPEHGYEVFLSPAERRWAERFIESCDVSGRPRLGIHIGSGGTKNLALRRWPPANFLALIRRLNQSHPQLAILLVGGPGERLDHERILAQTEPRQVFIAPTENLRQAAALLKECDAFLSVDTVMMHLAAAMKVPNQFVIETPTWNKPIEPFGNPFTLIRNPAVAGRNLDFYRYDGRGIRGTREEIVRSMQSVSVESVYGVLAGPLALLAGPPARAVTWPTRDVP